MEISITWQVILAGAAMAAVMGAVAGKTNFCTMGAVSDWINMGDLNRMRAWFLAVATAAIGVLVIEYMQVASMDDSRVPYRGALFMWPRYILGGLLFGIGMTIASGCGNKSLVRLGGGNIKSLFVILVAGFFAYLMTKTDMYGVGFHSWMEPISPDLAAYGIPSQEIGTLIGGLLGLEDPTSLKLIAGSVITALILFFVFKNAEFRKSGENIISGVVIGLMVVGAWYVTGGPMGQEWLEAVEFMDDPPPSTGVQSYTFINPMGELVIWLSSPAELTLITFGLASLFGVIAGSFLYHLFSGNFRIEWFNDLSDFIRHMIGAVLMGIGGVLALGCTIGQGVTGVSTMAIGSFMAMFSIIIGCALTMKVQYYQMVYEEEATVGNSLITGLADLRMVPNSWRKLEAL